MADLVIRPSIKGIILWYVLSAILLVAVVVFMQSRDFKPTELWALLILPIAIDLWASMKHVRLNARRLSLDKGILRYEDGLVSKTQRNIMLDKVRDVSVTQSLGQRLVGVGDLSGDGKNDGVFFLPMDQFLKLYQTVMTVESR